MIALLDTSEKLEVCQQELGCPVEQLLTPLTFFCRQQEDSCFAIDNGAFKGFDRKRFLALLARERHAVKLCRFVAVPDIVAASRRTLELFREWRGELAGWPLALVAQDGIEDLDIPWHQMRAVFIGGSTKWKLSKAAADVVRAGVSLDKWVHAGRVNTPERFEYFEELGAHSIDGTGLSRYSWMRERIHQSTIAPKMFTEGALTLTESW